MKISTHLGRLLAIFLIVGLVFAPLSAPANAGMGMAMGASMAEMMAPEMAADMPCCPDKSVPMDCDQCPVMATCFVKTFRETASASIVALRPVTVRMLVPRSDPEAESLNYLPPPRPPRSLVRSA